MEDIQPATPVESQSQIDTQISTSSDQPQIHSQPKSNMMMPVLVAFVATAAIFGIGGYYFGKQMVPSQNVVTQPATQTAKEMQEPEQSPSIAEDKSTYVDPKNTFSFEYPSNLKPFELPNGVVSFLPQEVYDDCKSVQGSKDIEAFEPCLKAQFNLNGFEVSPAESYSEYSSKNKDFAVLSVYTDSQGRTWNTGLVFGQVYNFDAFATIDSKPIRLSFQYGFHAPTEKEVLTFFNEILSTFKFTK